MVSADSPPIPDMPERIAGIIIAALQSDKGVHAETAIAVAAAMTGEYVLITSGIDLSGIAPGGAVFSDVVNHILFEAEGQLTVSDVFINALYAQGIEVGKDSWPPIPESNQVIMDPLQVIARIRPHVEMVFDVQHTEPLERAYQLASATATLVAQTRHVLNPDVGKSLAMEAMLKGAKTVPLPNS